MLGEFSSFVGVLVALMLLFMAKCDNNFFRIEVKNVSDKIKEDINDLAERLLRHFESEPKNLGEALRENLKNKTEHSIEQKIENNIDKSDLITNAAKESGGNEPEQKASISIKLSQIRNKFFNEARDVLSETNWKDELEKQIDSNEEDLNVQSFLLFMSIVLLFLDCFEWTDVMTSFILYGVICFMLLYTVTHWLSFITGIKLRSFSTQATVAKVGTKADKYLERVIFAFFPIVFFVLMTILLGKISVAKCFVISVGVLIFWIYLYYNCLRRNEKGKRVNHSISFRNAMYSVIMPLVFGMFVQKHLTGEWETGCVFSDEWKSVFNNNIGIIADGKWLQIIFALVLPIVSIVVPMLIVPICIRKIPEKASKKLYKHYKDEAKKILNSDKRKCCVCRWFDKLKKRFCHKD